MCRVFRRVYVRLREVGFGVMKCDVCGKYFLKAPCPHCGYYVRARRFGAVWHCHCLRCGATYIYDPDSGKLVRTRYVIELPDILCPVDPAILSQLIQRLG